MIIALLLTLILPLIISLFPALKKHLFLRFLWIFPLLLFIYFLSYLPEIQQGLSVEEKMRWIPSMGIDLNLTMNGLSLLFSLLITGIGTLIFYYAADYMQSEKRIGNFYTYLSLFMAAMLGVVLSDNLLLLFIFWELTSITSFFLIGFNHEDEESRKSAIMSLSITGGGGLFLLAAFSLLGNVAGTYNLSEMIAVRDVIVQHELYWLIVTCILIGAFTKSAQFPFHIWLPNAMKAPTPVSGYLHSATMVKAGVFLLALLNPLLGGHPIWNNTLMIVGGFTLLFGAVQSLYKNDLKAILAYSTVGSLGMMIFLIGLGHPNAITALIVFIIAHALYKAALFLTAGLIDHTFHTRDIRNLSGLGKLLSPTNYSALIVALSSAGMPLTLGFIGKDLIYEAALSAGQFKHIALVVVFIGNCGLLVAGFLVGIKPFIGKKIAPQLHHLHKPNKALWLPILILALLSLLLGWFPDTLYQNFLSFASHSVLGDSFYKELHLFPGFQIILYLSLGTLLVGGLIFYFMKGMPVKGNKMLAEKYSLLNLYIYNNHASKKLAFKYTRLFHNGYLRHYIKIIIIFFIGLVGFVLFRDVPMEIDFTQFSPLTIHEVVVFVILLFAIVKTVFTPSRLTAIASMGIVGYCMCLFFVFYGAPDLAMTQFTIDTLTVVLFVLVLFRLPQFKKYVGSRIQIQDGLVSIAFGTLIGLIALQAFNAPMDQSVSEFYAHNAYIEAKGKNIVNVILVDFRGLDTLVEITVLSIAALGVYSLLKLNVHNPDKK